MMKLKKSLLMAAMLATGVMTLPLGVQAAEAVTIKPLQGVAADFIKGADVSMVASSMTRRACKRTPC